MAIKNILKRVIKSSYKVLVNKNIRQLLFLYLRWYGHERYKKVENIKVFDNEESTLKRIAFAREHTYEKKLRKIKKLLNQSSKKMS